MRFLLINPPIDYRKVFKPFAIEAEIPPLGLLYIASSLEKEGHDVEIIDFCAEKFSKTKLYKHLLSTDAVGITVRSQDVRKVSEIVKFVKLVDRHLPVILGGPHCTLDPRYALYQIPADISVRGEGEEVITEIANALEGKRTIEEIEGICFRGGRKIICNPGHREVRNLDSLPFPARHLVEKYSYGEVIKGYNPTRGRVASIMMGRGCPYNCKYCINKGLFKSFRTRSAHNVIEELKTLDGKYDFLHIIDENFFVDIKKAVKILDFLEKETNFDVWISGIRVDVASDELFRKMHRAGVSTICLGIESGNQDVLDFYNKQITIEQAEKAVKLARKWRFLTIGYFMLGAPIEDEKHFVQTINFAKKLPLDSASFSPLAYLKGSPLWEEAVKDGKIKPNEYAVLADSRRGLGKFTAEELWRWVIRAFKEFYLRPSYILDELVQSFMRWDFRLVKSGFNLLVRYPNNVLKMNENEMLNKYIDAVHE